jgi:hypothetical protein
MALSFKKEVRTKKERIIANMGWTYEGHFFKWILFKHKVDCMD